MTWGPWCLMQNQVSVYNANKQTPKCIYVLVLIGMYIEMLHGKFFIALKLIKKISNILFLIFETACFFSVREIIGGGSINIL